MGRRGRMIVTGFAVDHVDFFGGNDASRKRSRKYAGEKGGNETHRASFRIWADAWKEPGNRAYYL